MVKIAFLVAFTCIHAFVGCACGVLAIISSVAMCNPAPPTTPLTTIVFGTALIMLSPFGWPSVPLAHSLNQDWIIPVGILANSYCWGLGSWHLLHRKKNSLRDE